MRLVAICTGKTRPVEIQGSTVQTAYLKTRVPGPCFIDESGPEGNETAVHPDSVYAIASEHYDYWADRLGEKASDWGYGYFAENLTIAGLDEQTLHVGDVLRIGAEVKLIVTGPRMPCFKVAWRMKQPQKFVRDFTEANRTGVYFAVLQPGTIEAGDVVEIIHGQPGNPTVSALGEVARGAAGITTDELARLLALPYLSKTAAVDAGSLPRFAADQFVPVRFRDESGQEFVRPWSLSSYDTEPRSYRITVKREDRSGASPALHCDVHKGSTIELRPPTGRFKLDRSRVMPVVLVGAGIGVTPLLAMVQAHLARGPGTACA